MLRFLSTLALCGACLGISNPATATPDIRILVDISKVAHEQDDAEYRSGAIQQIVHLLPDDGHGGVWGYAGLTTRFAKLGRTDDLWKHVVKPA